MTTPETEETADRRPPTADQLSVIDRESVVMSCHVVLSQIRDYVHKRFGVQVGPVWVTANRSDPADDDEHGVTQDVFQVRFGLTGRTEMNFCVTSQEMIDDGVEAVGKAYDRLMGVGR